MINLRALAVLFDFESDCVASTEQIHIYVCICMCVCIYICMYMYVFVYMCVYM